MAAPAGHHAIRCVETCSRWSAHIPVHCSIAPKANGLTGLSESLRPELASFGIRVLHLVPGDMRTSFVSIDGARAANFVPLSEPYNGTMVDYVIQAVVKMDGKQSIDPRKAAERIVQMVTVKGKAGETISKRDHWSRIPIGKESGEHMREQAKEFAEVVEELEPVWSSCEFEE